MKRRSCWTMSARKIDVIVVYKVDRLTRSLADVAKLVELFDAHGVSFLGDPGLQHDHQHGTADLRRDKPTEKDVRNAIERATVSATRIEIVLSESIVAEGQDRVLTLPWTSDVFASPPRDHPARGRSAATL